MNEQHTPGPWFYDDSLKGRLVINSERASVAVVPYLDREAIANARLIAAAPDILTALKNLLDQVQAIGVNGFAQQLAAAGAAIDRAENGGRS